MFNDEYFKQLINSIPTICEKIMTEYVFTGGRTSRESALVDTTALLISAVKQ